MNRYVPVLPENAPFTAEQRAYLNGFLAGLYSYTAVGDRVDGSRAVPSELTPLTILFGSQTGNAERLARRAAKEAGAVGFAATLHDLRQYDLARLPSEAAVLIITSTFGDGDPPDNAMAFWNHLKTPSASKLEAIRFSLCALGDSSYPRFCQFGKDLDSRLEALGARRVCPRQDCDVEFERPFQAWLVKALAALKNPAAEAATFHPTPSAGETAPAQNGGWTRSHPYQARLKTNHRLSGPASAKEVRHFEVSLGDSKLTYEAGDALGVWPVNCPELVDAILKALGCDGEEEAPGAGDSPVPLRLALLNHYELGRLSPGVFQLFSRHSGDPASTTLASPDSEAELRRFLGGRDLLDLLEAYPQARPRVDELIPLLRKIQPRLYSISSSPKSHPAEVHLTVNVLRYEVHSRGRKGVASSFLAERCTAQSALPVFVHANSAFRPPPPQSPLIMIGPGTGIAPFRAFLQERRATSASGRNWLFFGDQHAATDFLYGEEIAAYQSDGLLRRLDLAWSRDQAKKVYVQDRMLEAASELWRWLEDGAAVYVCGDASRMARDVDAALHQVIARAGNRSPDQAAEYVQRLQAERRYARDVY